MAAIVCDGAFDGVALGRHVSKHLPAYACPLFVRRLPAIATTGTFKHRRNDLAREGFDPHAVRDPLFLLEPSSQSHRRLDRARCKGIIGGRLQS